MSLKLILSVFTSLILFACAKEPLSEPGKPADRPIYYLALGDSYTVGQSAAEDKFPEQIYDSLSALGYNIQLPSIVAKTGWSTTDLLRGLDDSDIEVDTFDFVTLCIGVNNQFRNIDTILYLNEFDSLVRRSIAYTGGNPGKVWVLSIPDYAFTPFGKQDSTISEEIDQYNAWNRAIAERYELNYVNITDISRQGILNPELVAPDNLHPSGLQYTRWINRFLPEIISSL